MRSCSRARDTASCEGQAPSRDAAAWRPGQAARGNTTTRTAVTSSAVATSGPDKRLGSPTVTVNAARRDGQLYAISTVTLQTDGGRRNGTHTRGSGGRRHSLRLVTVIDRSSFAKFLIGLGHAWPKNRALLAGSTGKAPSSQPTIPALMQLPSSSLEMKHYGHW